MNQLNRNDRVLFLKAFKRNTAPNSVELCVKQKPELSFGITSHIGYLNNWKFITHASNRT